MSRLTSVANIKQYLAITTPNQDALIGKLIARESALAEKWTGRNFSFVVSQTARVNGTGTPLLVLHDQPVISVEALNVGGVDLTASPDGMAYGFAFDDTSVALVGGDRFPAGRSNIGVSWTAGYRGTANAVVPAGNVPTLQPDDLGFPTVDRGVLFANGTALVAVTSNLPLVDEYFFAEGIYTFNAANTGASVSATFDYCPADVEQAVIEMVGLDLKQRDNLGISSKSLAGESVSYEKSGMPASVKELLKPYRRMAPS
jgi:hypothetical protein